MFNLSLGDPKQTQHLLALEGAKERLHLFEANLLKEGSFDSLVDGCEGVFHTASPVLFSPIDPQVFLVPIASYKMPSNTWDDISENTSKSLE